MSMFSTSGSSSSGCSRPTPNSAEWIAAASAASSSAVGGVRPRRSPAGVVLEDLDDQRAGVLALVLGGHRGDAVHLVAATLLVQPVGDLDAERAGRGRGRSSAASFGAQAGSPAARRTRVAAGACLAALDRSVLGQWLEERLHQRRRALDHRASRLHEQVLSARPTTCPLKKPAPFGSCARCQTPCQRDLRPRSRDSRTCAHRVTCLRFADDDRRRSAYRPVTKGRVRAQGRPAARAGG